MKKLLPLLCVAAFAASQYSYANPLGEKIKARQAAKRDAKAKEKDRSDKIAESKTKEDKNYKEKILDGKSAQELVQQAKLLITKSDSVIKTLTTIESVIDKSKNKNFKALENCNISVVPVMKEPFSIMKEQMKWLSESIKLVFKGFVAMGKIKQRNTPQEIDARGNISLGLRHFPTLEFYLFNLESVLVYLTEFIKEHKPSISDSVVIQKAVVRLKASMDEKNKKLFSKAQDTLANSIKQFKSACDKLCGKQADSDNALKDLGAYKFYLNRLCESVERFSTFLDAFKTWLSIAESEKLQSLADKCRESLAKKRESLAKKGHDVKESEEEEMAAGEYDGNYLDAEEDDTE